MSRNRIMSLVAWCLVCCIGLAAGRAGADVKPSTLRCEYRVRPLTIDSPAPRLSWTIACDGVPAAIPRGVRQTAYRILVASSRDLLDRDTGDLWDSGKVASDETTNVAYAGKALTSRQRCFWKVQTWLASGSRELPAVWSEPAIWEMGLLTPEDWQARWIRAGDYTFAAAKPASTKPTATVTITKATYGAPSTEKDVTSLVAREVRNNCLVMKVTNDTMGGDPCFGKIKRLVVAYKLGPKPMKQSVAEGDTLSIPAGLKSSSTANDHVPYLRRSLRLADKPVARARLYVTALGVYEMYLNGGRVGDFVFAPGWTDYNKRVRYQAYDVTDKLHKGENVLGALVGQGWYCGHIGLGGYHKYGKVPALLAQLEVTYADGSVERVVTDDSWKVGESGILSSDMLMGEDYDARLAQAGWDKPGFDDASWQNASLITEAPRALEGQVNEPVREIRERKARKLTEPAPGRWTFDLGQNMVGVVRLKVSAPAGTRLTIRHAEMLNSDGTIYTKNLRRARSTDTYICSGKGVETYQPRFTFHGFRYVEVTGIDAKPSLDMVTGIVIASDTPRAGRFACSDARINQLYSNICWGQRGNYLSIPTDCPQRDERLGWMGDAQVFIRTATYNADVAAFFTKWLVDVDDAQTKDGAFTDVSPRTAANQGTPAWADAGVICPWTIYEVYGDKRQLEKHYPAMVRWIEWCRAHSTNLIRDKNLGGNYGDWLSIGAKTPKDLIGTAYFAYSTHLVAKSASVLGKSADAEKYGHLFEDIKAAFNRKYVAADGRITGNTQCCYLMALKFDLLPDAMRAKAVAYLVDDIKARKDHLSTGFVGVSYLLPVLSEAGRSDIAYRLLLQDTFPSWLFSVKHGATTIWERWDGWTPDKGFQNPGMNSFNHYSLGSCGQWMFSRLAGIDTDGPGFGKLMIRPTPGDGLTWVKADYDSIHGPIAASWTTDAGEFAFDLTVPPNTSATVYVPAKSVEAVRESGKPAAKAPGVTFLRMDGGSAVFHVGSGAYRFVAK